MVRNEPTRVFRLLCGQAVTPLVPWGGSSLPSLDLGVAAVRRHEIKRDRTVREVRASAAEILAAVGAVKLRRIALFRAAKWAEVSTEAHSDDRDYADVQWVRAAEWLRIGWRLPSPATP